MSEITLKKGKLTSTLLSSLDEYYSKIPGLGSAYYSERSQNWKENPDSVVYLVREGTNTAGWIIYNGATSAIEEI